jgi:hypothetical protein
MMKYLKVIAVLKIMPFALVLLVIPACKKAIELGPSSTTLNRENVYTTDGGAQSLVSGVLSVLSNSLYSGGSNGISILQGLAADELTTISGNVSMTGQFYTNSYSSLQNYYWPDIYRLIYSCNVGIIGVTSSSTISAPVKDQLVGELKFIRAYCYFYAYNLYGDVPLPLSGDYLVNNTILRSSTAAVQQQILLDLKDAQSTLPDGKYLTGTNSVTTDRVRPNKQAATAMLARVYLYLKDWINAEAQSALLINSSGYLLESNLNQVFLKSSREAIWQLMPVRPGVNNLDAPQLVLTQVPDGSRDAFPLSTSLIESFEPGDGRSSNWIGKLRGPAIGANPGQTYYFALKYKNFIASNANNPVTEYPVLLRLAEQYLIRSEARAQQGNIAGAVADLNMLRRRARESSDGLPDLSLTLSQSDCLTAIAHERRIELFTEQGHRWFDLKRTGQIDAVMEKAAVAKGGTWSPFKQLLPIPATEININRNLIQNPGY